MPDPGLPSSFPPPRRRKTAAAAVAPVIPAPAAAAMADAPQSPAPPLPASPVWRAGFGALLLAVALAPIIGGAMFGGPTNQDTALAALRLLLLLAAACLSFAPLPAADEGLPGSGRIAGAAALLLWLTAAFTLLSLLVHSRFLTSPVLLFAMVPGTLDWLCYALVFTLAASIARQNPRSVPFLVTALIIGGVWASLSAVREYGQFAQMGMRDHRAQGTFFSPNFLAGLLALTLPLVIAWFVAVRERMGALGLGAMAAVMAGALVSTGSRAGIALAALGLLIAFVSALFTLRGRLPWGRIAFLIAAIALLGFAFRGPITTRAEAGGGQEHSGAYRTWTWKGTLSMAKANPVLGTGPGTFSFRYPRYAQVARTELAHSSYLQLAAEQGFPALLTTLAALAATLLLSVSTLFHREREEKASGNAAASAASRLLLCGLIGGLTAAAARSVFDSEWSILGNGLPFWAAAGLAVGIAETVRFAGGTEGKSSPARRPFLALVSVAALVPAFCVFLGSPVRDRAVIQRDASPASGVWPPDPTLLSYGGKFDEAAVIEPSGKRLFKLGRAYEQAGNTRDAIAAFKKAVDADPNSLQTWRELAQLQTASGDRDGALQSWRELVRRQEGPVGQIRAIPELTETHPAFAYAALADDARAKGNVEEARSLYQKAAGILEEYSRMSPLYQQVELASAQVLGINLLARRAEIQTLYARVMEALTALSPDTDDKTMLEKRRKETSDRFEKLMKPDTNGGTVGSTIP